MSCKRLSKKAHQEQDYYLEIDGNLSQPTDEERLAFLRYDSHGGKIDPHNPIFIAKTHYGMYVKDMQQSRAKEGWIGGYWLTKDATKNQLRFLREAFGQETIDLWLGL